MVIIIACTLLLLNLQAKNLSTLSRKTKAISNPVIDEVNNNTTSYHLGMLVSISRCNRSVTIYKALGKKRSHTEKINSCFHLLALCIFLNSALKAKGIHAKNKFHTKN